MRSVLITLLAVSPLLATPAIAAPTAVPDAQAEIDRTLAAVGPLEASGYHPQRVVDAINRLQPLGKAKGAAALRRFLKANPEPPSGVFAVMRVLLPTPIVGKAAIRAPALGAPTPTPTPLERKHLPQFPILVLDDVPLSVVEGYTLGGLAEPPVMYLDHLAKSARWLERPLAPKTAGSVLLTLVHFGLYAPDHPVTRLIEGQLKRLGGR